MSRRESISRYNLIIKKLKKHPATFKEIADYLALESELQEYDFNVSKRTFQRDVQDIRTVYNIDIRYDFSEKLYYLDMDMQPEITDRILEAFDTFNALNISDRLSDYIHFEKRHPKGTENLYGLLHAIKNRFQIRFRYQKFWEDKSTSRTANPLALKEFKNRWYVLAEDLKDGYIKSFALDRLTDLEITKKTFEHPMDFDVKTYYKHCFGIIGPTGEKPEEVILSFDPYQGKYIKTLPLHESQEVLKDNKDELLIRLNVYVTHDLIMELLSYGDNVEVIKPDSLVKKIKEIFKNASEQY